MNGSGLPVFSNVRRQWNEYRLGADVDFAGFKFTVLRRWDFLQGRYTLRRPGVVAAGTAADQTVLQTFKRSDPVHGRNPGWLGNLFTSRKRWAVNARLTYIAGKNDFALDESAFGIGAIRRRRQPPDRGGRKCRAAHAGSGDLNLSLFPTNLLTIVNNTSVSSLRIIGPSSYSEVNTGLDLGTTINFRYLSDRLVANSTDVNYRVKDWIGFFAGYAYTDRLVRTIEGFSIPASSSSSEQLYEVTNHLHTGRRGDAHPAGEAVDHHPERRS